MSMKAQVAAISSGEARRHARRRVDFASFLQDADQTGRACVVANLSVGGCKLLPALALAQGDEVWVKLAGHIPQRSVVAWVEDGEAGIEFSTHLNSDVVEELRAISRLTARRRFT